MNGSEKVENFVSLYGRLCSVERCYIRRWREYVSVIGTSIIVRSIGISESK